MSTALIILTLNEIDGVKNILPKIDQKLVDEILVVDGGSTDGTIEHVKKLGFKIIIQSIKGHGGAILTGIQNTKSDKIVLFGPDGNHDVDEIGQLIKKIDDDCQRMKTHPILGHVHDHQGKCEILDGSINNNFVLYDTENSNAEFIITLGYKGEEIKKD